MQNNTQTLVTYQDILDAEIRIRSRIGITSLRHNEKLSQKLNCDLYIKYENENVTGAFKERGALNKLLCLTDEEKKRGVIAASAGNHAQGVAYHAGKLNIPVVIVMPKSTPINKISTTKSYGAKVVLAGDTFDECLKTMHDIETTRNLVCIHPFDNPHIIAGQGTIGLEINRQIANLDSIIIPIGGGGMIAGMTIALKGHNPNIKIYGVQSSACPAFYNRFYNLSAQYGSNSGLAEGIAVKKPGELPFDIVKNHLEDIIIVDETIIEEAVSLLLTECKTVAEGAGAAGLAGILTAPDLFIGKKTATILCGGNIDTRLLASVMTRTLFRQERLFTIEMTTTDRPGFLANVAKIIGDFEGNITAVRHNRYDLQRPAKDTQLSITIEARDSQHAHKIKNALKDAGYHFI